MSHPARLSLRAPPHLPFIQGWPGIPSSPQRKVAAVQGTVEVRIGPLPIKAKWVRAEIRKYESVPPGFPSGSSNETWEHVGEVSTLWAAPAGKDWDNLEQADFKFFIPLPDNVAPSVEMSKGTGVRYELVAALCYRQKGGVFKKESSPIMKISEPIRITRHDVHSAWPLYNMMDAREIKNQGGDLTLTVQRPGSGFGPTDRILFTASLKSMRPKPFKLKGFECSLVEVTTVTPQAEQGAKGGKKGKGPPAPVSKSKVLASARHAVDESVGRGGEKTARMDLPVPGERLLVSLSHGRSIAIRYELEVKAVCDSGIPDIGMGKIPYTVGPFARSHAQQAVRDIGYVESLCPGVPTPGLTPAPSFGPSLPSSNPSSRQPSVAPGQIPTLTPSPQPPFPPNGFYANGTGQRAVSQPVQGFTPRNDFRRKSSGTSTMTTTTTTTFDQHAHAQNQLNARPQSMQPKSNVAFPTATPAPALQRAGTGRTLETNSVPQSPAESIEDRSRFVKSDMGHGDDKRYSTGTTATFGRWDKDLRMAMAKGDGTSPVTQSSAGNHRPASLVPTAVPKSRTNAPPPSSWQSAEQEKSRLYDDARNRAAAAQSATGASLATLGFEDLGAAPPEYAPPRPKMPAEEYKAPERPLSVYGARGTGSSAAAMSQPEPIDEGPETPMPTKPSESKELVQAYQTAAEEKEQQKKRFEEAQAQQQKTQTGLSGVAIAGGASPAIPDEDPIPYDQIFPASTSAGPSQPEVAVAGSSTQAAVATPPRAPVANGVGNEKEQMRRFYEAQDRVARAAGRSPVASPPGSVRGHGASTPVPTAAPALSEKEQMRRYYEAQDRVAQAGGAQGSATQAPGVVSAESSPARGASGSQSNQASAPTGLSEKEQMRRFYEAQDRVAQASQSGQAGSTHGSPAVPGPSGNPATPVPSAISEKEQMRRFYEAQDRVARASEQSADGHARTPSADVSPNTSYFPPNNALAPQARPASQVPKAGPAGLGIQGGPPMSGLSEKEQMRRFYEAQDRVARAAGGQSSPMVSSPSAMDEAPGYDAPPQAGPSNGTTAPQALASPVRSPYPSAEEEKEQMRRRFEDAQAAVERKKRISSPPPVDHLAQTNTPPDSPVVRRDPTIKAGKAKARTSGGLAAAAVPTGPPPPLPTKPPKEYINLLSPVGEPGPSFARMGMEMNGNAGANGSGGGASGGTGSGA